MAHLRALPTPTSPGPRPALTLTDPLLVCLGCDELVPWSETVGDRCAACADFHRWYSGGAA